MNFFYEQPKRKSTQFANDIGKNVNRTEDESELDLTEFKESYLAMDPNIMWTLKSGCKVKTVIYEFAKTEIYMKNHIFIPL